MTPTPEQDREARPRILLLRALGLGDFLTGVPAYRAVRRAFPEHEIVLAAPAQWSGLSRLTGAIDWLLPTGELRQPAWPHPRPDLAIDLHGKGPASHRLLTALRPRRLIAFDEPTADPPNVPWRAGEHEVHRWCRLLTASGIPADPDDLDLAVPRPPHRPNDLASPDVDPLDHELSDGDSLDHEPLPQASPYDNAQNGPVLIHPGAAAAGRRWPPERFAEVAAHLHEAGHRVLIAGSSAERPLAGRIAQHAGLGPGAVLAGTTTPLALAALVARCRLLISGDTGVAHLATAYRRPSVVLFGPVPPSEWGPPADRPWHVAIWNAEPGYRGDPHGTVLDPALARITVKQVLAACDTIAAATASSHH